MFRNIIHCNDKRMDMIAFQTYNRRDFLKLALGSMAGSGLVCGLSDCFAANPVPTAPTLFEARFYEKLAKSQVQCHVCPHNCVISEGQRGVCGTRENREGILYSLVYGKVAAENIDPIEKKPFYHVLPGSQAYSIATAGCNMRCKFCQNWQLSQSKPEDVRARSVSPDEVARTAERSGIPIIAYTYSEPTVFAEFVYDCAVAGKQRGIRSVVVSNGFISGDVLDRIAEVVTAYKIDFKAFSKSFYQELTGGNRDDVMASIKRLKKLGVWTELVHLTIPTLNDNDQDLAGMGDWLMGEIGPEIPVHFTQFHPTYRLTDLPVTPVSTLERARSILMDKGLKFVYIGNVPGHPANSTWCPRCGDELISRTGFSVVRMRLKNGACGKCGTRIPGIWS